MPQFELFFAIWKALLGKDGKIFVHKGGKNATKGRT